ncbi:MAG: hypothetical protein KDH96_01335 [Candidatus Riesia sp.]|nr:hypothetical protein [Candidatus Riesia sp.]
MKKNKFIAEWLDANSSLEIEKKVKERLEKENKRFNKIVDVAFKWGKMIEEGHLKLVDADIEAPLKVQKIIPLTEEGVAFLKGN